MKQERLDPGWAWTKKLNISAGVKLGETVILSGTVALDSEGNVVGQGDVYAQSRHESVYSNNNHVQRDLTPLTDPFDDHERSYCTASGENRPGAAVRHCWLIVRSAT